MIRISNLSLPVDGDPGQLARLAARKLGVGPESLSQVTVARQSIDARRKSEIRYVYTVDVSVPHEAELVRRAGDRNVVLWQTAPYIFPPAARTSPLPPVVVGMGPAGLFAALFLARAGIPSILLERGGPVEERTARVERFWASGDLDPESNVQFGEGGAGTFSDGKLTTGTHDPRLTAVTDTFLRHGAPEDIRWSHKPHIGTDVLRGVVVSMRRELLELGCEVRFRHRLTGLKLRDGTLAGLTVEGPAGPYDLAADTLVLAPGHSARDTFQMLFQSGVPMEAKPFAMGLRIEHLQATVGAAQYGPLWEKLPPADYKLACHLPNGRSVFTFCVCPGGQVVAAASEPGRLVTNGMSLRARDGRNINGGLLVGLQTQDFGSSHPLAGMEFQALWEERAYRLGGGDFRAPAATVGQFLGRDTPRAGGPDYTYRPGVCQADLTDCLPGFAAESLRAALPILGQKLRGFDHPAALLTGVETRSSSPVRLLRGEDLQSPVRGIYPCGEGGGWAGGIMSAAADGIRVAEQIAQI